MVYDRIKKAISNIVHWLNYLFGSYLEEIALTSCNDYRVAVVNALEKYGDMGSMELYKRSSDFLLDRGDFPRSEQSHSSHIERLLKKGVITVEESLYSLNIPSRVVNDINIISGIFNKIYLRKWLTRIPEKIDA